jgi:methylmalonyl-CoA/ethylmalonyl-CoA epimerase
MKFDQIGLVVADIREYYEGFLAPVLGVPAMSEIYTDTLQRSKVAFAVTDNGVRIELIEPLGPDSPVAEVLKRKRGGLHHLCFEAQSLETDIARLKEHGCMMISPPKPAVAFNNRRVVFLFTPTFEVIELVEEDVKARP